MSIGAVFGGSVVFAPGVLGIPQVGTTRARGGDGTHVLGLTQAGTGFPVCAAVVAYGIHPILPQFH
ncbi:hypothetical protein [Streptomyces adustus]|uniref:hypothetical protein n=1 Tax=Streptomyces adustus TaxID=1609272 RepID=UPI003719F2C8